MIQLSGVPVGDYKSIKFSVGVESRYNDNLSLQIGELSQLNGMTNISWMWMTSYIFTSVGGTVKSGASAPKNMLVETGLNTNYKTVTINLPTNIRISSVKDSEIVLKADVEKALDGVDVFANPIVGASKATIMAQVATNYATKVFTVASAR
ncbi:MbnP family protein [Pedobacter glucosidilyticus]|uniref:MbnP family protein n=1 Tax=Pedobacter glucosidilyticus TaxID=1122941 RepID=UPI0026ED6099|nr:MbnP family protein [Pedobacter glucosidilyticus]